ncbi:hypothetical protein AS156_23025 [Bradyrhizobium macuxiense]|uniref:Inner membrane protein n=1 Tax=Bradyrhizobium macuxiense TaxID=1755647 RepID=A0A120FHG3_9BRAD|nr:hypothetical protein [Bradyrhizobium macuxiense]KWV45891.1 hypothetical protein AS156_23025 [Bradyrhizobium macuxiense]
MAEDRPEDTGPSPDSGRPRRAPPTIDLEATNVSSEPPQAEQSEASADTAATDTAAPEAAPQPEPHPETASEAPPSEPPRPVSPWVVAPVSGAVAAALVIAVGWLLGWPQVQPAPQLNAAAIDDLSTRVAGLEAKVNKPAAADPRLEALDKSIAALRSELAATRAQSDKLAAAATGAKTPPDVSAITARIDRIEGAVKAQNAEIANTKADAKPADDATLRRVVAASLLDVAVRHGDPFVSSLAAAKALADDPDILKPLEAFAASGVPNANELCRDLIEIVPKLAPPPQDATTGAGLVDRLQAGASKLIRIERTDGTGTDRGSIVARMTSAAVHNDLARAERELKSLPPADRTAAQAWIERVDARRAALDASRKFADNAMAALASVNQ